MFVLKPIDPLFSYPELAGSATIHKKEKVMFWKNSMYSLEVNNRVFKWKSDENDLLINWSGLNSGVTVVKPSNITLSSLLNELGILPIRTCCPSQEFLYNYFNSRKSNVLFLH